MKIDYERLRRVYAHGDQDAGLLLEEMLREAVRISGASDKGLGSCVRRRSFAGWRS